MFFIGVMTLDVWNIQMWRFPTYTMKHGLQLCLAAKPWIKSSCWLIPGLWAVSNFTQGIGLGVACPGG